jgi:hypothetical protein
MSNMGLLRAYRRKSSSFSALRWAEMAASRARTTAPSGSVWRQDTLGNALPVAHRHRETALPDAWWRAGIWRTQGLAQRQLQAWPLHRRGDCLPHVAEGANSRGQGAD